MERGLSLLNVVLGGLTIPRQYYYQIKQNLRWYEVSSEISVFLELASRAHRATTKDLEDSTFSIQISGATFLPAGF